jgi:hypothetical protein
MKINYTNRTIEITKAFANKAKNYGSNEYALLQEARKDNRGFSVVVVAVKKKSAKNSRITLADMERYISAHDDEQKSKMGEFEVLRNAKEHGELYAKSFFEIKKWFFEAFPEVA